MNIAEMKWPTVHKEMQVDVAIIGAGFSGATLAIQLLRRAKHDLSIVLIDREDRFARGVAYGSTHKDQLLNVAAGKMSALADEPGHFTTWLAKSHGLKDVDRAFLPRHLYGEYLEHTLSTAIRESPGATVCHVPSLVSSLSKQGDSIRLEYPSADSKSTGALSATFVIVATGNYPPPDPPEMHSVEPHRYVGYPWAPDALEGIGATDAVLILGSGLTAVDQVFTLKNRGFRGAIHILSSRGLLPRSHETSGAWSCDWAAVETGSILRLMREVRRQIAHASEQGTGWRAVIDSLRSSSQSLWRSLPLAEQRRFLRHVRSFWDVHRHRVSPEIYTALRELIQERRLTVWAGRCIFVLEKGDSAEVVFRRRGQEQFQSIQVNKIINCTGPNTVKRLARDPLMHSIFQAGMGRPDSIGMGLETMGCGEVIDGAGRPDGRLFAIGPIRKGGLWETTAVPEIRNQALDLADRLLHLIAIRAGRIQQGVSALTPQIMAYRISASPACESQIVRPSMLEESGL